MWGETMNTKRFSTHLFILFFTLLMNISPGYANGQDEIGDRETLQHVGVVLKEGTIAVEDDVESQPSKKPVSTPPEDTDSLVQTKSTQNSKQGSCLQDCNGMQVARCAGFSVCALLTVTIPATLVYLSIKFLEIIIPQINYPK